MSTKNFPYGAEPAYPAVRESLQRLVGAKIAGRKAFEDYFGRKSDKPLTVTVDAYELKTALTLAPITEPGVDTMALLSAASPGDLIRQINARFADGSMNKNGTTRALGLSKKAHQFSDDDFVKELDVRLQRPGFASKVANRVSTKKSMPGFDITDEELIKEVVDRINEDEEFVRQVRETLGKQVFRWLKDLF